ncbi:MAG: type II toxin-antitoxin system RelE/ParE family toxin [Alcaligenaceae bacterium]|nr:type II toxin-antitoxin system RelE/ParE family toxin [Alcaligenaceae bacterium]
MSLPVLFRAAALIDINEAYHWYEEKQKGLGAAFMAELGDAEALIGDNPELFRKVHGEVRRAILHKFPYGVFYVARPESVSVVAVMRHARNPKHWQDRA